MTTCSIKWCGKSSRTSNYKKDGITFHRFPQCPEIKQKWMDAACRGESWFPTKNSVICSRHFSEDNFHKMKNRRRLFDSAVPTLYLPILAHNPASMDSNSGVISVKKPEPCIEATKSIEETISLEPSRELMGPSTSTSQVIGTPNRKRKFLPSRDNSPSAYDTPVKKRLCRRITELTNVIKTKNIKLRKLRDSNRRLKRQIISLKSLLAELEKKELLSSENCLSLDSLGVKCREILQRQICKGKTGKTVRKKYSPQLRAFAMTLNFYSTKAYNYVRKTFNTCLPSVKTIGKWYQSVDARPGFTKEAFEALKFKAQQSHDPIHCCIIFDEMKIMSDVDKSYGYVDFGGSIDSDCKEECTEALVFLVVPLRGKWKLPIGYFLINKVSAEQKKFLLTQAIELCNEAKIIVKAVTFDGCPTNLSMAKKLGCVFDPDNLKTVVQINNNEIAFFPDPVHMLKLVRNSFEHYKEFKDTEGNTIKWNHIELLHQLQEDEKFHAANKLRAAHLQFKKNIMKVKLVTQLFSKSVAIALQFLKNTLKIKQFQDVEGTAKMLLAFNDLFDILDSKMYGYGFKRSMNLQNSVTHISRLEECKSMLLSLTTKLENKQTKLIHTPRFTGFIGLLACIESAKFLYYDLVESQICRYISFHRVSQDHIELFFCNIRSHGGSNNNPTAKQFYGIYRKLLMNMELQDLNTGNCVALENINILHCSSAISRINMTTERGRREGELNTTEEPVANEDIEYLQQIPLSEFSESIIEYIAGAVVHYLTKHIKCNTCAKALVCQDEKVNSLIYAKNLGGLAYPSSTVTKICRRCEQVIRASINTNPSSKVFYKDKLRFVTKTLASFVNEDIFSQLNSHQFDHEITNHVIDLAKSVMDKYIDIRLLYLSKKSSRSSSVRRVYTKLIHFKNQ